MTKTARDIKQAQAVTRWVEDVKERAQHRTRVSGSDCNTSDAEYVAAHIEQQAERIAELEAFVGWSKKTAAAAAAALGALEATP